MKETDSWKLNNGVTPHELNENDIVEYSIGGLYTSTSRVKDLYWGDNYEEGVIEGHMVVKYRLVQQSSLI